MSDRIGQAVARERLRARLVELRSLSGLGPDDVIKRTHWSASKLNRIETGAVTVQPTDLQALLRLYELKDADEVDRLINLAVVSRRRAWWSGYQLSPEYKEFVAYEDEASRISVYQALFVPGLLQTEDYARAITTSVVRKKPDDAEVEKVIAVRMRRQQALFDRMTGDDAPEFVALLDGAVLERPVGGSAVMRKQLDHLLEVAQRPHVRLVVIPLRHGGHAGLGGIFALLEFAGAADPDVVFIESTVKDFVVRDEDVTAAYHDIMEAIIAAGLTREAAYDEVRRIRTAL
jgi:hypothetical protein